MDYGDIVGAAPKNLFVTGLGKRAPMFASTIGGRINWPAFTAYEKFAASVLKGRE